MKKTILLKCIVAAVTVGAAAGAMAYPQYSDSVGYGSGVAVERFGRVFQHCWNGCESVGFAPEPGNHWYYGNSWDDRGLVGSAVLAPKPASAAPASTWQAGKGYSAGATVTYNGVKYVATRTIVAGEFTSQVTPNRTSAWTRG